MVSASMVLQRAVVSALAGDSWLQERFAGVYDAPPPGATPPYLVVGPDIVTDWSTKSNAGREHRLRVTVWEQPLAVFRCGEAIARIEERLGALPAILNGHRLVSMRFLRSFVDAEAGGSPTRGQIEFRARTWAE